MTQPRKQGRVIPAKAGIHSYKALPQAVLLALIRLYQLTLSALIGRHCRFHPSCSHYAQEAITQHGAARGSLIAFFRIARCGPWHELGNTFKRLGSAAVWDGFLAFLPGEHRSVQRKYMRSGAQEKDKKPPKDQTLGGVSPAIAFDPVPSLWQDALPIRVKSLILKDKK